MELRLTLEFSTLRWWI